MPIQAYARDVPLTASISWEGPRQTQSAIQSGSAPDGRDVRLCERNVAPVRTTWLRLGAYQMLTNAAFRRAATAPQLV